MKTRKYYYSDVDCIDIIEEELKIHNLTSKTQLKWQDLEEGKEISEKEGKALTKHVQNVVNQLEKFL